MYTRLDRGYIDKVVNKLIDSFYEKIRDKKLICYGASALWTDVIKVIDIKDRVEFFVDGDSSKWGDEYYEKEIKSPDSLRNVDKDRYAVVVLPCALEAISRILDSMGWEKDVNYFDIFLFESIFSDMLSCNVIDKYLMFLETVPGEIMSVSAREDSERIGIILNAEGLNYAESVYIPYMVSLFLLLKWKGYNVKLIVDRLHWEGDMELYEGHCNVRAYVRDTVINRLGKIVPKEDILYLDAVEGVELSIEDERECERIAEYSVDWSKWYNVWNSRFKSKKLVQDEFAEIFKRNLSYIKSFFEKNHFDTINAITALHKMAGVYYYAGKRKNMRVSSQDGLNGETYISSDGPALYSKDIPRFIEEMWDSVMDQDKIFGKIEQMWKERRNFTTDIDADMNVREYMDLTAEKGKGTVYTNFQTTQKPAEEKYDVIIPLNLFYDGAMLGVPSIFGNQAVWLKKTIDYVVNVLKRKIMIREHPMARLLPKYMKNCEVYTEHPEILEPYKGNELLRYVRSDEDINIYPYIEHCKVVIPWTSSTGVEAGIMKKNLLVHTDVYYKTARFALYAHTEEEYFQLLKECIMGDGWQIENEESAYKDALKYFYCTMHARLTTDFTYVNFGSWNWQFADFKKLLEGEGVDEIVQIVGEGRLSPDLIEKQYRRSDEIT